MTNKLEISRELAQKVDDLLYIMTGHDSYPRLVHKYGKEWWASINEMRAEICTLLATPVVERQGPVEGLTRYRTMASGRMTACDQGFYVRYSDVEKLYAEQPAPVAVVEFAAKALATITSSDGSGHADISLAVLRQAGYQKEEAKRIVDEWKSQRSWETPNFECQICRGSRVIDDGELHCSEGGIPYENGPIKCVKDCPACLDKVKELNQ